MLRAARDGGTIVDVAVLLGLSVGMVRGHLSSAISEADGRTRAGAVRLADDNGGLPVP
jgi:two-component system response regulator DesR